jgi:hypothetical protein
MTNKDTVATYRPEIEGEIIPTFSVISGKKLREMYVVKKRETQIMDWIEASVIPSCVPEVEMLTLLTQWKAESRTAYPGEGDYRVRILDEFGQLIPMGSVVEFITDADQIAVDPCAPGVPTCADRVVVFQICNFNEITDDNFDIYLNDVYIGAVDLSANAQVGSVFIASTDPSLVITSADFDCPVPGMIIYRFNPNLLKTSNTILMSNTQNNGAGNAGIVGIRNYLVTGTDLSAPCVIADLTFGPSGGEDAVLTFEYTECCP